MDKFKNNEKLIFIAPHRILNIRDKCETINNDILLNCKATIDTEQNLKIIEVIKNLKNTKNVFIYDFKNKFCKNKTCYNYLTKEDKFVFIDNFNHLSKEFAEFLSEDFEKFLEKNVLK